MLKYVPGLDAYESVKSAPGVFVGSNGNRGDKDTASGVTTLFYVEGDVAVRIFGVCTVDVAGASGTIEVGVPGNTAALIAQTTATDIDQNEIWFAAAPADVGVKALASVTGPHVIVNGLDIQEKIATADLTGGNIYYICLWKPLSPGASVKSAYPAAP